MDYHMIGKVQTGEDGRKLAVTTAMLCLEIGHMLGNLVF